MKTKKEEYIDKMAEQLKEWSGKVDELESRAGSAASDMKTGYAQRVRELREKRETVTRRLAEVRDSSGEAWEAMKVGVETAWSEFKDGITAALDKFKKAA